MNDEELWLECCRIPSLFINLSSCKNFKIVCNKAKTTAAYNQFLKLLNLFITRRERLPRTKVRKGAIDKVISKFWWA